MAIGFAFGGAALVSIVAAAASAVAADSLKAVPLNAESDRPLSELERFARQQADRLKRSYDIQLAMAIGVAVVLLGVVVWSVVMVTVRQLDYGVALSSTSAAGMVLAGWKWQPLDRIRTSRRLADEAQVLALGVRRRLAVIEEIKDPEKRQRMEWEAVLDFLAASRGEPAAAPEPKTD